MAPEAVAGPHRMSAGDAHPKCPCSHLRGRKKWDMEMDPAKVAQDAGGALEWRRGYTSDQQRHFCLCRVCGTRWTVSVDVDVKEMETRHVWKEEDWTEEDLAAQRATEDAAVEVMKEREVDRSRRAAAERAEEVERQTRMAEDEK